MEKETHGVVIAATKMNITFLFHFVMSVKTLMDSDIIGYVRLS